MNVGPEKLFFEIKSVTVKKGQRGVELEEKDV